MAIFNSLDPPSNSSYHKRSKHIYNKYHHYVRAIVDDITNTTPFTTIKPMSGQQTCLSGHQGIYDTSTRFVLLIYMMEYAGIPTSTQSQEYTITLSKVCYTYLVSGTSYSFDSKDKTHTWS